MRWARAWTRRRFTCDRGEVTDTMRAMLLVLFVVLVCLLAAPAQGDDLEATGTVAAKTVSGSVDWLIAILSQLTPERAGPMAFTNLDTIEGGEALSWQVAEYKDRCGFVDLLLSLNQRPRGVALTFEPFRAETIAVGPAYYKDEWGAVAIWHFAF